MSSASWQFVFFVGFFVLYFILLIGALFFMRWRRKTKWPFKESDRLLRSPGEGLRREILAIDERIVLEMVGAVIGALILWLLLALIARFVGLTGLTALLVIGGGMLVGAVVSVWRSTQLWKQRSNHFLGWFGERLTAEKLQPLQSLGYRIFHDVPAEPGAKGFNIDHVVVGPSGVTAVEVKTRRKGNARDGYKDHEVSSNGSVIDWPSGSDQKDIQQTLNEADWVGKALFKRTGLRLVVKTVLTFPGWYVRETPSPGLRVINPNFLPDAIHGRGEAVLTPHQIDLISRQLELLCRTVED